MAGPGREWGICVSHSLISGLGGGSSESPWSLIGRSTCDDSPAVDVTRARVTSCDIIHSFPRQGPGRGWVKCEAGVMFPYLSLSLYLPHIHPGLSIPLLVPYILQSSSEVPQPSNSFCSSRTHKPVEIMSLFCYPRL